MNFDLVDFSVLMLYHFASEDFLFLFNGDDSIAVVLAFEIDEVKSINFEVAQRVEGMDHLFRTIAAFQFFFRCLSQRENVHTSLR